MPWTFDVIVFALEMAKPAMWDGREQEVHHMWKE
jgi:hypothetical protein